MANNFKTPTIKRGKPSNEDDGPALKIPGSPYMETISEGTGISVFEMKRDPRVDSSAVLSPWAVKKRHAESSNSADLYSYDKDIENEAEILRKLNHPNIIGFRGIAPGSKGEPCLMMEKLETSLGSFIREMVHQGITYFPIEQLQFVAYEIAKGLCYLHHKMHILHADMKSYNVVLTRDCKTVKICDFGTALPLNEDLEMVQSDKDYYGTKCWNAPEVIKKTGPITNKTDIWAYGIIVWEMIAMTTPHFNVTSTTLSYFSGTTSPCKSNTPNNNATDRTASYKTLTTVADPSNVAVPNYGTRPELPPREYDKKYKNVTSIYRNCTEEDQRKRPSAQGLINFFKTYVNFDVKN